MIKIPYADTFLSPLYDHNTPFIYSYLFFLESRNKFLFQEISMNYMPFFWFDSLCNVIWNPVQNCSITGKQEDVYENISHTWTKYWFGFSVSCVSDSYSAPITVYWTLYYRSVYGKYLYVGKIFPFSIFSAN